MQFGWIGFIGFRFTAEDAEYYKIHAHRFSQIDTD